jgi:aspartate 1-decarboxylase
MRTMLRGKIHRATVTGANLEYQGSITVDRSLLDAAGILPFEQVDVWNVTNGERFQTYAMEGARDSGVVVVNGAAAHRASAGDRIIIAAFSQMSDAEALAWTPRVVLVDAANRAEK